MESIEIFIIWIISIAVIAIIILGLKDLINYLAKIKMSAKNEKITANIVCMFTIICLIFFVKLTYFNTKHIEIKNKSIEPISIGDTAVITNNTSTTFLATTKDNYEIMRKAVVANDNIGLTNMVFSGSLFMVEANTKCLLLDISYPMRQVRIMEGTYFGKAGWVCYECVK